MFRTPVANSNTALETSRAIARRSTACAGLATGGHAKSRGITDHSFASSTGLAARPTFVCRPWVTAYSHDGRVGQSNVSGRSRVRSTIALWPRSGLYAAWERKPVTATIVTSTSSTEPRAAVSHGPRSGERQKRGRNGPGGGVAGAILMGAALPLFGWRHVRYAAGPFADACGGAALAARGAPRSC